MDAMDEAVNPREEKEKEEKKEITEEVMDGASRVESGNVIEGLAVLGVAVEMGMTAAGAIAAVEEGIAGGGEEAMPREGAKRAGENAAQPPNAEIAGEARLATNAVSPTAEQHAAEQRQDWDGPETGAAGDDQFKYRTQDLNKMAEIWAETEYALAGDAYLPAAAGTTASVGEGVEVANALLEQGLVADKVDEAQIAVNDQVTGRDGEESPTGETAGEWERAYRALLEQTISGEAAREGATKRDGEEKRKRGGSGRNAGRLIGPRSGAADIAQAAEYARTDGGGGFSPEANGQVQEMFREILAEIKKLPHGQDSTRFSA